MVANAAESVSEPILILKLISAVKGHRLRRRPTSRHREIEIDLRVFDTDRELMKRDSGVGGWAAVPPAAAIQLRAGSDCRGETEVGGAPAIHDTQNQSGKKEGLPCHSEAGGLVKEAFVV